MQVINRFRLREFWQQNRRAESQLRAWHQFVCSCDWQSAEQLAEMFVNLNQHAGTTDFDIHGSTYFVRTSVDFGSGNVYVREVLLHSDYRKRADASKQSPDQPTHDVESDSTLTPGQFSDLIREFEPRPIRDVDRLHVAASMIDLLLDRHELSDDEKDFLDLVTLLVADYESQRVAIPTVSGAEVLRYLIMEHRASQVELIPILGRKAKVAELLKGSDRLNLQQIARASRYFKVPGEVFFDREDFDQRTGVG